MPRDPLTVPPPDKMVQQLLTPDHTVGFFAERVKRDSARFQELRPIKRGTKYESTKGADSTVISSYPSLFFLKEVVPYGGSELRSMPQDSDVIWFWASDPAAESSYNSEISYLFESVNHPAYARVYTIRRSVYEASPTIATGSALTGLIGVNITAAGTGYTYASGTIAIGATVTFVVSATGTLIDGIVTNEGSSVTTGGSITITGDGTGATATARIQPATTVLVGQKKQELPDDDPASHEYVRVIRVYETLPGYQLTSRSIGQDNLIPPKFRRQVSHVKKATPVISTYTFPSGLTGDQSVVELEQQTSIKSEFRTTEEVIDVSADPLKGQDYDQTLDVVVPYIETLEDSGTSIGQNRKEITPTGAGKDIVRTVDPSAIAAALGSYLLSFPGTVNLQLPDVLESISITTETSQGDGDYSEDGVAEETDSSTSLSIRGTGQASAAIIPEASVQIKQIWGANTPIIHYLFFLPVPVTAAAVVSKITTLVGTTINAWPHFVPVAHTLILTGQRLSLQVTANSQVAFGSNDSGSHNSYSTGTGASREVGLTVKAIRIPPTIHGVINVSGTTSDFESLTANAEAEIPVNPSCSRTESGNVYSSVTPTSFSATSPSSIPTSGLYILRTEAEPYRYGYAKIHCEVVDFANVG